MTQTRAQAGQSSYAEALQELRLHQKTSKGAPAYSRFVNRRAGRHLAALAFSLGLTPNQVTGISSVFTFAALLAVPFTGDGVPQALLISAGLLIGYALDSADGQLARLRGGGSSAGEWLDHVLDSVKSASVHVVVLLHFHRLEDVGQTWLLVPLLFSVVANVWFFTVILTDQLRRRPQAAARRAGGPVQAPVLRSLLALPTDYGVLCLVFATLAWPGVFLPLYSLLLVGCVAFLAAALPTWFRELQALDSSPLDPDRK